VHDFDDYLEGAYIDTDTLANRVHSVLNPRRISDDFPMPVFFFLVVWAGILASEERKRNPRIQDYNLEFRRENLWNSTDMYTYINFLAPFWIGIEDSIRREMDDSLEMVPLDHPEKACSALVVILRSSYRPLQYPSG
jgi:hypothetical protein